MKKTAALLLAILLAASSFASCAKNTDDRQSDASANDDASPAPTAQSGEEDAEPETEFSYVDSLGERDFDGASYVVAVSPQGALPTFAVELTGEAVNDAIYTRDRKVMDAYNVSIEYPETADSPTTATGITNCVLAGDYYCDVYMDALSNGKDYLSSTFRKGALYNLLDVPNLQLDQPWWSALMYEKLQLNGKMFFTSGDMAIPSFGAPSCVFMDLAVAENHGIDENEIYQLVYDNAWTIDEVMKRTAGLRTDLNGDGVIVPADDAYGIVSATVELTASQICVGAGIRYCEIGEDGHLAVNLDTEEVLNKLEKLRQCFCEIQPGDDWSVIFDNFKLDRELFLVHFVGTSSSFRDMESDFTILPMPKYDVAQETYMSYTNPHGHSYVAIPLIQPDIERTGFLTEVLEYLSVEMVRPTIYDITLKGKVARNLDSQRMLDIIFDTAYIDFNALNNFGQSTQVICNTLFGGYDFVSAYQKYSGLRSKEIAAVEALFD